MNTIAKTLLKVGLMASILSGMTMLTGCSTPQATKIASVGVESILVVPVVNETHTVNADLLMESWIPRHLSEVKGYYVFPLDTVRLTLEQEGLYEADRIQQMPPEKLAQMFHADSVLFVKVKTWDATYKLLKTTMSVDVEYNLYKNDGTLLYQGKGHGEQDSNGISLNPIAMAVDAAIAAVHRAKPSYEFSSTLAHLTATDGWEVNPNLK